MAASDAAKALGLDFPKIDRKAFAAEFAAATRYASVLKRSTPVIQSISGTITAVNASCLPLFGVRVLCTVEPSGLVRWARQEARA